MSLAVKGLATDDIRAVYTQLTREDVEACLGYAASAEEERVRSLQDHTEGLTVQRAEELSPRSELIVMRADGRV